MPKPKPKEQEGLLLVISCVVLVGMLLVTVVLYIMFCRSRQQIIYAKTSYIIKKKIVLETPSFESAMLGSNLERNFEKDISFLPPLVKIDSVKTVQVDLDPDELSKCGATQYEFPHDPQWEMDRHK